MPIAPIQKFVLIREKEDFNENRKHIHVHIKPF